MKTFKRKGFTLVELLIIMIVLSILTGAMMLSSTKITASADASRIINNLVNIKNATIAWYFHNRDKVDEKGRVNGKALETANNKDAIGILKYLNAGEEITTLEYFKA